MNGSLYLSLEIQKAGSKSYSHIFQCRVGAVDKKKLYRVEAVEVACLVQGGPAEVILFIFGTAGIEKDLADLILLTAVHERSRERQ